MTDLWQLNQQIINCRKCQRLVEYREAVARTKTKRFADQNYWGRPVPGFGDENPEAIIVGLAPAAHGANRTGRMFTGDSSGDWLYKALYETGFATQPVSESVEDGMSLNKIYITASVRCAPPQNKPLPEEIANCRAYLQEEIRMFDRAKIFVALGQIAFKNICRILNIRAFAFGHNLLYDVEGRYLLCSYHPSRQNTQTRLLLWEDWINIFIRLRELLQN